MQLTKLGLTRRIFEKKKCKTKICKKKKKKYSLLSPIKGKNSPQLDPLLRAKLCSSLCEDFSPWTVVWAPPRTRRGCPGFPTCRTALLLAASSAPETKLPRPHWKGQKPHSRCPDWSVWEKKDRTSHFRQCWNMLNIFFCILSQILSEKVWNPSFLPHINPRLCQSRWHKALSIYTLLLDNMRVPQHVLKFYFTLLLFLLHF